MTDWIMTEEERRPDREIYYISEDDPVVKLMEAHKEALAEIERLKAALRMAHRFLSEHDLSSALSETALIEASEAEDIARAALEGKE